MVSFGSNWNTFSSNRFLSLGKFQKFDYGSEQNQNIYGSVQPPEYNYSNIQTKLHIMYGTNDILVMPAVSFVLHPPLRSSYLHLKLSEYAATVEKSRACRGCCQQNRIVQSFGFLLRTSSAIDPKENLQSY